ncbi:MAG: ABC transporter permease [Acidobacteriota bacterium]|nr:ABC transporter permease [Acidobacteriota bacterium]
MSTPPDVTLDSLDSPSVTPQPVSEARRLYWSIRREVWENRSIYLAPLIVAAFVLFASLIAATSLPKRMRSVPSHEPAKHQMMAVGPSTMAAMPIMFVTFVVGAFYSFDALYGERRDRSILFWKSLPVSDRTTVLSKAAIPLVVLPLIAFALGAIAQFIVLLFSTVVLLGNGLSAAPLWSDFRFLQEPLVTFYHLMVHLLYLAPFYGWLLLVSAWARRAPLLWAVLPPIVFSIFERMAFRSKILPALMEERLMGAMRAGFTAEGAHGMPDRLSQIAPLQFVTSPGLWIGLAFTAACLAAAVRLRRNREPI